MANQPWIAVSSRAFTAYRYDEDAQTMDIEFPTNSKGTPVYRYENVSPEDFADFAAAPSKGSWVMQELVKQKEKYPFRRLTPAEAQ